MGIRFLNQNFIDLDVVSNNFVSSEQAAFPVLNVYNKQRRSKVWRSEGYWEIFTGENTIVFQETVGVDLTATVANAEYTSSADFFAAIKTALEDAGASTYTVAADTTSLKVKITSDGLGGGGILKIKWTSSTDMADTLGFDSASDDSGALTYTADALKIHTNEWIKWDMGISTNPQSFVLIGPRNTPIKISPSAILKLQGNETNVWTSPSYQTTLTYDDSVITVSAEDGLHTEALRYWRLNIVDPSNPLGYVEIGTVFLGNYYESTRGQAQFPFGAQQIDRSETVISEGGQTFSDIREKTEHFQTDWKLLTTAEKEELEAIFEEFGTAVPLFVHFDPDGVFTTTASRAIRYVKFESEPQKTLQTPNNWSMNINLLEQL